MTNNNLTGALSRIEKALENATFALSMVTDDCGAPFAIDCAAIEQECEQALSEIAAIRAAVPDDCGGTLWDLESALKILKSGEDNWKAVATIEKAAALLHQIT